MKTHVSKLLASCIVAAALSTASTATAASTSANSKAGKTPAKTAPATTPEKTPAQHREHIKNTVNATATRPITVTSEHRKNSAAHGRGAVDIRSRDIPSPARHEEAKNISRALGKNHTVIVEEVHRVPRGAQGPEAQINTAYRNGQQGNTRTGPIKATETHTHIQPDRAKKK